MTKLFSENGFLNVYGKETFDQFLGKELDTLLNSCENVQELQLMKAIISKYVGDKVAERVHKSLAQEVKAVVQSSTDDLLDLMLDEEFLAFVSKKYGHSIFAKANWGGVTPKEYERLNKITQTIRDALITQFKDVQPVYPQHIAGRKVF